MSNRPRVVVTRGSSAGSDLAVQLEAAGFEVASVPLIETEALVSPAVLAAAVTAAAGGWVVLTSAVAARMVAGAGPVSAVSFAVVGEATARAIREAFPAAPVVVAEGGADADALAATLAGRVRGTDVLVVSAEAGRRVLAPRLRAAGAGVTELVAYRTRLPAAAPPVFAAALLPFPDALVFASGSAARNAAAIVDPGAVRVPLVLCIGATTLAAAGEAGWTNLVLAATTSDEGIVATLRERLLGA